VRVLTFQSQAAPSSWPNPLFGRHLAPQFSLDPEFQEIEKAEQTEKTLEKAELIYMRPTDFSSMK
jgi:hypothetical protein